MSLSTYAGDRAVAVIEIGRGPNVRCDDARRPDASVPISPRMLLSGLRFGPDVVVPWWTNLLPKASRFAP